MSQQLDSSISPVVMKEGVAGIELSTIDAIVPDSTSPKTKSVIYTTAFPDGLIVQGSSEMLLAKWSELLSQYDAE